MKYGKRLRARAVKGWLEHYIDYKGLKKYIKDDIANDTPQGSFEQRLQQELEKVNDFFAQKESELWEMYKPLAQQVQSSKTRPAGLPRFCRALNDLRNFVVLNYFAVIKIVKKWNKKTPSHWTPMDAFVVLRDQPFYQSPRLSTLTVRAELLALELSPPATLNQTDWSCPICHELLRNPVALDCTHRFCWTCLFKASEQLDCCPVCGKDCLLDGPNMQVDWILTAFLQKNFPENPQLPVDSWESLRERMMQAASEGEDPNQSESSDTLSKKQLVSEQVPPIGHEDLCATIRALRSTAAVDTQPEELLQRLEKQLGIALGNKAAKELLDLLTSNPEQEKEASEGGESQHQERDDGASIAASSSDGVPLPVPVFIPKAAKPSQQVTAAVEPWLDQQAHFQYDPMSPLEIPRSNSADHLASPTRKPLLDFTSPLQPSVQAAAGFTVQRPSSGGLENERGGGRRQGAPAAVPTPPTAASSRDPKAAVDPRKYKTQMCRSWMLHGCCTYAETCCFAHGQDELRSIADNHRTLASIGYFSNLLLVAMSNSNKPALPPHLLYQQPAMFPEPKSAKELDLYSRLMPQAPAFPFQQPLQAAFSELRKGRKGKKKRKDGQVAHDAEEGRDPSQ